jgi:hypothetical protein
MNMIFDKKLIIVVVLTFCAVYNSAQTKRQFSGSVEIDATPLTANVLDALTLQCNNENEYFYGQNVMIGDIVVDGNGHSFEIDYISPNPTSTIYCTAKCLDGVDAAPGTTGVLFRPTAKGLYLSGANIPSNVLSTALNAALLSIDSKTPNYYFGSTLPAASVYSIDDVVFNTVNSTIYKLTSTGWVAVTGIQDSYSWPATAEPLAAKGTVVRNLNDMLYYVCDGTTWTLPQSVNYLPASYNYGDVFYTTSDNKLYMMGQSGSWMSISSSTIPSGSITDLPTSPKIGDFFFDKVNNILYVYDSLGRWVVVSINGSTPSGGINPDPATVAVKEGEMFYNSSDKKLYVYNGSSWLSLSNSLTNGQIFIGNSSNIPVSVPLSGDATINSIGQLTVKAGAITNSKLDKTNIPLDGFGRAQNYIEMGDGTNNYQIKHLAIPTAPDDAATKGWVDMLFATPATLGLNNNSMFVGNASNRATMVLKNAVPISDFGRATSSISMGPVGGPYVNKITDLANPLNPQEAATKYYVDNKMIAPSNINLANNQILVGTPGGLATAVAKSTVSFSDFGAATNDVLMGGKNLKNLHEPTNPQDAATMNYVDSKALSLTSNYIFQGDATNKPVGVQKVSIPLSDWGMPTTNVSMGGINLTDLADPRLTVAGLQDAATRKYVDGKVGNVTTGTTPPPTPTVGSTYYNTTDKVFYVYDGIQWIPVNNVLPNGSFYIGDISNKAVPIVKSAITLSGFGDAQANISMGTGSNNYKIINVADPAGDQDVATKKYVDGKAASVPTTLPSTPVAGNTYYNTTDKTFYVYDGSNWTPVDNTLANGKLYVGDATNKAVATAKSAIPLSGFGTATSDVAFGAFKITGLGDPAGDQDAATKKYVDGKIGSVTTGITPPAGPTTGTTYYNTTDKTFYVFDGISWVPVNNILPSGELYVGDASNKATPIAKSAITLSGFGDAQANISMGTGSNNYKIINVADPAGDQDAATKKYVDGKTGSVTTGTTPPAGPTTGTTYYNTTDKTFYVFDGTSWLPVNNVLPTGQLYVGDATNKAAATAKNTIPLSGFAAAAADIDLGIHKITNVVDPTGNQDAATKKYVDGKTGSITTGTTPPASPTSGTTYYNTTDKTFYVYDGTGWIPVNNILPNGELYVGDATNKAVPVAKSSITLSGFGDAEANISMGTGSNNYKIINVADPAGDQDAATKKYVDGKTGGVTTGTTPPPGTTTGTTYYNTTDKIFYVYDGTGWVPAIPGDNLGNHTATKNIKTATYAISSDGVDGKGLTFETAGNAIFAQDVTVKGNFYTPSDKRLKTNIETLGNTLQAIDSMRGVRFEYKDQKRYAKGPKIGVIAQELMKVYPEMVVKGTDGFYKVDYTQLSAVLIQAVKEQQQKMKQQQLEIDELKVRLDKQQMQINAILKKFD